MSFVNALIECLGFTNGGESRYSQVSNDDSFKAQEIVDLLYTSEKASTDLRLQLQDAVSTKGWTDSLAQAIYNALEAAVASGKEMGPALKGAHERAVTIAEAVTGFANDHPVIFALIILGILVILMPWVIEILGFTAEGPLADSFAAAWQSRYGGLVPKGSLFSFFQRLGMKGWV